MRLLRSASHLLWTDLEAALGHFGANVVGLARDLGDAAAESPDAWLAVLSSLASTYDDVRFEALAVRGERLALLRQEFVADGFVTPALLLVELDEAELIVRLETFAEDDLATAVDTLEERFHALAPPSS